MKTITLCGSTKYKSEFERVMAEETLNGSIVISVGLFGHEIDLDMNSETKRMLDRMHFRKIDMADEIYVVNPGGYIGLSTCDEIHYAMATGKGVRYLVEPECLNDVDGILDALDEEITSHAIGKGINVEDEANHTRHLFERVKESIL